MAAKRPSGAANTPGRRLIDGVLEKYELDAHETELLTQAAACADVMADLQRQIDAEGAMVRKDLLGPLRPNPALVELRSQQATYMALLRSLGLPSGPSGTAPRKPRKTAFEMGRGPKKLQVAPTADESPVGEMGA